MKRKAKTMAKILEENPDAYFDGEGGLKFSSGETLDIANFYLLGKVRSAGSNWGEGCCKLLEPLPEKKVKKLYAYNLDDEIVFSYKNCHTFSAGNGHMYSRFPEYDIIYNKEEE